MDKLLAKIGWAAGDIHHHAHLLTLDRDDPHGSAAVEDARETEEQTDDPEIVNEDDRLDDDDLDDQPRGRRSEKAAQAYDKLKSERDRLQDENQKQARLLEEMNSRLSRIEQSRETREDTNRRADEARAQVAERSRQLRDELSKLRKDDPEYSQKYFEVMEAHNERIRQAEREQIFAEMDRRSQEAIRRDRTIEEARADAEERARKELAAQNLGEDCLELVQGLATFKEKTDPDWFRRTPSEEQIPALVSMLKERVMNGRRSSQAFRDEKARHRADMDGVLGEGSTSTRRGREQRDDRADESPGSLLADLRRNRENQRKFSASMLRSERR